jgi:4-amino-4-deoxy-L-arabinose transferase-like glycosyltransferase
MDGLYSKALVYFLIACVCALPGILGAAFGRGPWMVLAGALSAWTLYAVSPFGMVVHALSSPTTPFWVAPTVGIVLAAICACLATIEERRKRPDNSDEF